MHNRAKLKVSDTLTVINQMSEGNPGAVSVIMQLLESKLGFVDILSLDDMDMRGPQIWAAFKHHCDCNIEKLREALKTRDAAMVTTVNRECPDRKAVTSGASFEARG